MVRNLLSQRPECMERPKVLLLGISYPDVEAQMEKHGFDEDVLFHKEPSVDQAVECVRRGILTEMDARDLARCVATEDACKVDVYSASKEIGAVYRDDRHIYGDFNARNFCHNLREAFGDGVQFSQIILDYYWMPTGWLVTRWAKTLFQRTLPNLVKYNMLTYPSTRSKKRRQTHEEGVVLLPFCAHVCKELVGAMGILKDYYAVSFVNKSELADHSLWKGTMSIDGETMQARLGKRLDQEEFYCTFKPKDIYESMEDPHVSKDDVMRVLLAIKDYKNIRMVKLRPLRQHEPPSVMRERLVKPEIGGWKGLNFELADQRERQKKTEQKAALLAAKAAKKAELQAQKAAEKAALQAKREAKKAAAQEKAKLAREKKRAKAELERQKRKREALVQAKSRKSRRLEAVQEVEVSEAEVSDHEDVEEVKPSKYDNVPDVTFFFPGPTCDLYTYDNPEPKKEKKEKEITPCALLIAQPVKPRATRRSQASAAKQGFQDLDHVQNNGPEYLSFNPRRIPSHKRRLLAATEDKDNGVYVSDLHVKERANDPRDTALEGALDLFDIRHAASLKGVSRKRCEREQLTCYKIPKQAVCDALEKSKPDATDSNESQEDYDTIQDMPIFQMAIQACRGQWESVLDAATVEEIRVRKAMMRKNRWQCFADRTILLDAVVRWLAFEQDACWDPTGDMRRVHDKLIEKRRLRKDQSLAIQATVIEKEWHKQGKNAQKKKSWAQLSLEEHVIDATAAEATQEPDPEICERARQWLEGKDSNTPAQFDSDFQKIAYLLERGDLQSEEDRAKELALSFEIARNVASVATKDKALPVDLTMEVQTAASTELPQKSAVIVADNAEVSKEMDKGETIEESTPAQNTVAKTTAPDEENPTIAQQVGDGGGTRTVDRLAAIAVSALHGVQEKDAAAEGTSRTNLMAHLSVELKPARVAPQVKPTKARKAPRKKAARKRASPKQAPATGSKSVLQKESEASYLAVLASAAEGNPGKPQASEPIAPAMAPETNTIEATAKVHPGIDTLAIATAAVKKMEEAEEKRKASRISGAISRATIPKLGETNATDGKRKEPDQSDTKPLVNTPDGRETKGSIGRVQAPPKKRTEPPRESTSSTKIPQVGKGKKRRQKEPQKDITTFTTKPEAAEKPKKPQGRDTTASLKTPGVSVKKATKGKPKEPQVREMSPLAQATMAKKTKAVEGKRKKPQEIGRAKTAEGGVAKVGTKPKRSEMTGIQDSLYRLNPTAAEGKDKKTRLLPLDSLGACGTGPTEMNYVPVTPKQWKSKNKSAIAEKNSQGRKAYEKTPASKRGRAKQTMLPRPNQDRFAHHDSNFIASPARKPARPSPATDDRRRTPIGRSQRVQTMPMLASLPRPRLETQAFDDAVSHVYSQRFSEERLRHLHSILNSLSAPSGLSASPPSVSRLGLSFNREDSIERRAVLIELAAHRLQSAFGDDWGRRIGNDDSAARFMSTLESRVREEASELFRQLHRARAPSAQCVSPSPPTAMHDWRRAEADAYNRLISQSSPIAARGQGSPIAPVGQRSPIRFAHSSPSRVPGRVPGRDYRRGYF